MTFTPKTTVQLRQVGAWSRRIQLQAPMGPIPEARRSLSSVRFFNGSSCFLRRYTHKISGSYRSTLPFRDQNINSRINSLTKQQPPSCSQYPEPNPELSLKVRATCGEMSMYSAKTLRELSAAMRTMTEQSTTSSHMSAAAKAAKCLQSELHEDAALLQVMHVAVIASLLSDLVSQIKQITESVDNLAKLARFKKPEKTQKEVVINVTS
jgi:hypothetical protein